jgi:hypothetical protein
MTEDEVRWMLQWQAGYFDPVECPVCGWIGERQEIGMMYYGDYACGYFKIRSSEHWCPSCGHDWQGGEIDCNRYSTLTVTPVSGTR